MGLTVVAGVLLVASALRIYEVSSQNLWIDEANGVLIAQQPLPELLARLKLDSSPPLYYLILHGWMMVFGDSEAALRAPSVLAGVVMVACVFLIGRRLFSLEVGALAATLVAVSPIQIFFSQQARMYALLPLLALLSTYWLWRAISDGRRVFVVAYGLATLAALYTHNVGLYLLPAHAAILLWSGALRRHLWTWLVCAACIVVGYLPWLPTFLAQLENKGQYNWFLPIWKQLGVWGSIVTTLVSFAPGTPQPLYVFGSKMAPSWVSIFLFSGLAVLGLARVVRRLRGGVVLSPQVGWLVSLVCIPAACALLASRLVTPHYVPGRIDQLVFPAFVLLVGMGLTTLRPVVLRYAALATLLVFSALGLRQYYGNQPPKGEQALAQAIAARAQPGDAVLCTTLTRAPIEYYLGRLGVPVTLFSYPPDVAQHLGNIDEITLLKDPARLVEDARRVEQEIKAAGGPHARFFLVLSDEPVNRFLRDELVTLGGSKLLGRLGRFRQTGVNVRMDLSLRQF